MADEDVAVPECLSMQPDAQGIKNEPQGLQTTECPACKHEAMKLEKKEEDDVKDFLGSRISVASNYNRGELTDDIDDVELYGSAPVSTVGLYEANKQERTTPLTRQPLSLEPDEYPLLWEPRPPRYRKFTAGTLKRCPQPLFTNLVDSNAAGQSKEVTFPQERPNLQDPYDDSDIYGPPSFNTPDPSSPNYGPTAATCARDSVSLEDTAEIGQETYYMPSTVSPPENADTRNNEVLVPNTWNTTELDFDDDAPPPAPATSSTIYGNLRKDIYGDSSDLESSDTSSPILQATTLPSPQASTYVRPLLSCTSQRNPQKRSLSPDASSESESEYESQLLMRSTPMSDSGEESDVRMTRIKPARRRRVYASPVSSESDQAPGERATFPRQKRRRTIVPKPGAQAAPSLNQAVTPKNLPIASHNRARRIVVLRDTTLPLTTVSMRGDVNFFHALKRHRIASYSLPCRISQRVADVCNVGNTIVIGFSRGPNQVNLVSLEKEKKPHMTGLIHYPHKDASLTCLTSRGSDGSRVTFFTGGTDRKIYLWTQLNTGAPNRACSELIFRSLTIPGALCNVGRKLLCGTGTKLLSVDVDHPAAKPYSAELSNLVHQIHVHPSNHVVSIVEVRHREEQILIFDSRDHNKSPAGKFGYKSTSGKTSSFYRGSTWGSYFARGFSDGNVCLWDYRNPKIPVMKAQLQQSSPVIHTWVTDRWIACYSNTSLTFVDFDGNCLTSAKMTALEL